MGRIWGALLLIVGVVFLVLGINASQGVSEKVVEGVTGHFTEKTMLYLIAGVLMVVGGWMLGSSRRGR